MVRYYGLIIICRSWFIQTRLDLRKNESHFWDGSWNAEWWVDIRNQLLKARGFSYEPCAFLICIHGKYWKNRISWNHLLLQNTVLLAPGDLLATFGLALVLFSFLRIRGLHSLRCFYFQVREIYYFNSACFWSMNYLCNLTSILCVLAVITIALVNMTINIMIMIVYKD